MTAPLDKQASEVSNISCPECSVVQTSDGPRVRLCAPHAGLDRLAEELAAYAATAGAIHTAYVLNRAALEVKLAEAERRLEVLTPDWRDALPYESELELAQKIAALEADLAAKTAALERLTSESRDYAGSPTIIHAGWCHAATKKAKEACFICTALASSPGAAWVETAKAAIDRIEALDAFSRHTEQCDDGCDCCEPETEADCAVGHPLWRALQGANRTLDEAARALLARPEGMRGR